MTINLQNALEGHPVTLFACTADLHLAWIVNPPRGMSPDALLGRPVTDLLQGGDAPELEGILRNILSRGVPWRGAVDLSLTSGRVRTDLNVAPDGAGGLRVCWFEHPAVPGPILDPAIEHAHDCFFAIDRNRRVVQTNTACARYFGVRREDLIGRQAADLFPGFDRTKAYECLLASLDEGSASELEYASFLRQERRIALRTFPTAGGAGVWFKDVTAYRIAEGRLRRLFDSDIIGIFESTSDGTFLWANDALLHLLGRSRAELEAGLLCWRAITPPDCAPLDRRAVEQADRTGASEIFEKAYLRPDGTHVPVLIGFARLDTHEPRYIGFVLDLTERKRIERELKESQHLFRRIADLSPNILYIHDLVKGGNIYVNGQVGRTLGYTAEEVKAMGDRLGGLVHPDDVDRFVEQLGRFASLSDDEVLENEFRMRHADGSWRRLHSRRVVFARSPEGMPMQILGIAQDVTERRAVEDALRTSELRLRLAMDAARLAYWEVNLGTGEIVGSPLLYEMYGFAPGQRLGVEDLRSRYHPEDRERVINAASEAWARGDRSVVTEFRVVRPDGSLIWVLGWGEILVEDGKPSLLVGMAQDITERKNAETALADSRAQFASIFDQAAVGIVRCDLQGRFDMVNELYCQLVGRSREELMAMTMAQVTYPDDVESNLDLFAQAVRDGRPFKLEKRYVRSDGSVVWVNNSVTPIRDREGNVRHMLAISFDITERKMAEEHQRLMAAEIDHRAKNMLAIIQAVVNQTKRGAESVETFAQGLSNRVRALARTHDLLSGSDWKGALLDKLIRDELDPYRATAGTNIHLEGPSVFLEPRITSILGLVFHELATNAAKYGALSSLTGRLRVVWELLGEGRSTVRIRWTETGGPPVRPPSRRGFGSVLVERSLGHQTGGEVHLDFRPEGLECTLVVPLD